MTAQRRFSGLWQSFAASYDPEEAVAGATPRLTLFASAILIGVFLGLCYAPGLSEAAAFRAPWVSIACTLVAAALSLLSYRHRCRGMWGTLGCLLDNSFYVAAIAWAAANTGEPAGVLLAVWLLVMLVFFQDSLVGATVLLSLAIVVPVIVVLLLSRPSVGVSVALLMACACGIVRLELARRRADSRRRTGGALLTGRSGTRYRIGTLVGAGGTGVVYRAVSRDGAAFAIKRLHAHWLDSPAQHRRLLREALIVGELKHEGIVPILDHGVVEGTGPFLVMPLLSGNTLSAHVRRMGGRLPWPEVVRTARDLLGTLAAAHARDVVHCDVKPNNVFLCDEGSVKLLDFGVARPPAALLDTTLSVHVAGTPACMAPEQVLDPHAIDARTDLWGLGATMFWAIAGEWPRPLPEPLRSLEEAARLAARPIGSVVPDLPRPIASVIDTALRSEPGSRFQSAQAMLEQLMACSTAELQAARPVRLRLVQPSTS